MKKRLGIFASGTGSNAININNYFRGHDQIEVVKIYCNNPSAGIIPNAAKEGIALQVFTKQELNSATLVDQLKADKIDYVILAGFLWLIPPHLIAAFPNRIINIHPALLPNYGGKGMYGMHVHEAVIANNEKESGITIHLVSEEYDKGAPLFQAKTRIESGDTPERLAKKIHALEYAHFPETIEHYVLAQG